MNTVLKARELNGSAHQTDSVSWTLVQRLFHWGPLIALGIIKFVFFTCVYLTSWWLPPYQSLVGTLNHVAYMAAVGLVMYNFLCSVGIGGGFVPKNWKPKDPEAEQFLQFCALCNGWKAPRSHHCRRCGRCVLKMDHHCPWINACVGHRNHRNFISFLFFCVTGAIHSIILLAIGLHKAYNVRVYEDLEERLEFEMRLRGMSYPPDGHVPLSLVYLSFSAMLAVIFSIGLCLGVIIALGVLLYFQVKIVLRNETGIESWINQKAEMRLEDLGQSPTDWLYPYDLGCKKNFCMVFGWNQPEGNGIDWPVRNGCTPYTFTLEQKLQKEDKRRRQRVYVVVRNFSGSYFAYCWSHGCCACLRTPLNSEPRLRLLVGGKVLVTRWKKCWLYGELTLGFSKPVSISSIQGGSNGREKMSTEQCVDPPKGWFPMGCVVPCVATSEVSRPPYEPRSDGRDRISQSVSKKAL